MPCAGARLVLPNVAKEELMPEKETLERARRDRRQGKSASTQAGEFVREEIHHVREGKHGARSTKQAIAIGLSKARRAGVKLPRQKGKSASASKQTARSSGGKRAKGRPSRRRSTAIRRALRREGHSAASPRALARHARTAARQRPASQRSAAAKKASRTKGSRVRKAAARKAARTRARRASR
jgi:hypothetical protein